MKKIVFILSVLILFPFSGCSDDLLTSTPYGQSTSDRFWRNADDVVAATNAIYEPMLAEDFLGHAEMTFDICSDDMWRAGDHGEDQAIEDFTFDPSNPQLRYSWSYKYEMISRANAVLINASKAEMDESLRKRCLGEAYFLRGFAYWRLYLIYGEVPVFTEEDVLAGNLNKAKSTFEQMQTQIESDWLKAVDMLPVSYDANNLGRASQGTAYGFLTKLYVYEQQWAKAIQTGEKITTNAAYKLADSFVENFQIATENNPEVLFALQYKDGWTGDDCPAIYTTPRPWGGWDFQEPIQDLVDEFEEGDPRLSYTVFRPGDQVDLGGEEGVQQYTTDLSQTGYHFRKYASWRTTGGLDQGQNAPLLRSADVYLLVAEAKIQSGQSGDAELNAVRIRNGLQPKSGATMEDIIHERRVELACENERHQDLMRWDKAGVIDIVAHYKKDRGPLKPARNFQRPKHYYFALPQREIDLSNGVLKQNENYAQ
ncbi:RagB/SusD family nutrient uptake outer membrane protein [Xanthocytophaga agilis]|uniref:RagB/SusD family nutrient uptake outer membrane protein n=1 Tax=Xanthocytophaga agilis TaxID=3048010 RepID=A0AAE3UJE2_9BACT|nr:RagB/SusD family nutrient uptake outer membrane protein [Xanthocytophaga agilis]MDJ1505802.1 RagB/SusD family nutrient uptake outer membrane protein [Xanthocytophaga agilis]